MGKELLKLHIESLSTYASKGVSLGQMPNIRPELRERLREIKKETNLSAASWNRLLASPFLIEAANAEIVDSKVLDDLLSCFASSEEEWKEALGFSGLSGVHAAIGAYIAEKEGKSGSRYYSAPAAKTHFLEIALYASRYGMPEDASAFIQRLLEAKGYSHDKEKYDKLGESRIEFLRLLASPHSAHVNCFKHFQKHRGDILFFERAHEALSGKFEKLNILVSCLEASLEEASDKEGFKSSLLELIEKAGASKTALWLSEMCAYDEDLILESEVSRLLKNADSEEQCAYELLYGDAPEGQLLKDNTSRVRSSFLKKCIKSKKKAFLRLAAENNFEFFSISIDSVLFEPEFAELVNLNALNKNNLISLAKMRVRDESWTKRFKKGHAMTFNEFEHLFELKNAVNAKVFYLLSDLSPDVRLRLCKDLPPLEQKGPPNESLDAWAQEVANLIRQKPLHQRIKELGVKLARANKNHYLALILRPDAFFKFKPELKKGADVDFILNPNNQKLLELAPSLVQAKMTALETDDKYKYLISSLKVSEEFVRIHRENIADFCERGLHSVFYAMNENSKQGQTQLKNLRLITKAELAGRLEEIKFADKDFELEIGMPVSEEAKREWKMNRVKAGAFRIEENYDFETTIRIGEFPVQTCMHWKDGGSSQCLLSNFDTNKKVITARNADGQTVARALIRLTKRSDSPAFEADQPKLSFKDIEKTAEEKSAKPKKVKEELVLFLERFYSPLDSSQSSGIMASFVALAKEKAQALGAKLVLADGYTRAKGASFEAKQTHIYISRSKNGAQYLDSVGGRSTHDEEGKYKSASVLTVA